MKKLVLFYSYTGNTKALADELAKAEGADIAEIRDTKRPGIPAAYVKGGYAAIKGRGWPIQPLGVDLSAYEHIFLLSPVWGGNPPPAVNAALTDLPTGKTMSVKMVSSSGKSRCREKLEALITGRAGILKSFEDIKA